MRFDRRGRRRLRKGLGLKLCQWYAWCSGETRPAQARGEAVGEYASRPTWRLLVGGHVLLLRARDRHSSYTQSFIQARLPDSNCFVPRALSALQHQLSIGRSGACVYLAYTRSQSLSVGPGPRGFVTTIASSIQPCDPPRNALRRHAIRPSRPVSLPLSSQIPTFSSAVSA